MISIIFPPAIMGEKMSYWNIRPFLASCACSRMAGSTNRAAELYATLVMIGRRSAGVRGEKVRTLFSVYPIWFTYRKCCGCRSDWIRTRLPDPGSILISWILIRPLVHTKEHILVRERTAPPCVFQTFAHPTSPCSAVYSKYLTV